MNISEVVGATHSLLTNPPQVQQTIQMYHITPSRNIRLIMQKGLIPKIGRRARSLREPQPAIYLFPTMDDVENAVMNWLGEEFGENTRLALLSVEIPPGAVSGPFTVKYEHILLTPVPPSHIRVLDTNYRG